MDPPYSVALLSAPPTLVKYGAEQDGVAWSGVELLWNGWGLTTK